MKYNIVPSSKAEDPDLQYIYIFPTSFDGSEYFIAYPDFKVEDILAGKIKIRIFEGCSSTAVEEIETKLKERLQQKQKKYSDRLNTFFTIGIGVFILGIINWVIPDPLPFVDELFFTLGGGILVWKTLSARRSKLPVLIDQIYRYAYDGGRPEVEKNSILTTLFKSIRCKTDPLAAGEVIDGMDPIEIESLWITKYLSIQDIVLADQASGTQIKTLMGVLEKVCPLKEIKKLEKKRQRPKVVARQKTIRQTVSLTSGISSDALDVYIEFYRAAKK